MIGHPRTLDVVIVGAGITGLTAAWNVVGEGASVEVLEAGQRVGGVIASERVDGFLIERGPATMMSSPTLDTLVAELGLEREVVFPAPVARTRFVQHGGRLHVVPSSPPAMLRTGLLTLRGKMRAGAELFVPPRSDDVEESLADLVRRRFGDEVLDRLVAPFVGGVYAGDAEALSSRHCLRVLHEWEQQHGSVLKGAVRSAGRRKRETPRRMMSFRNGLGSFPAALAATLGDAVRTEQCVVAIRQTSYGWQVDSQGVGGPECRRAHRLVLALPAHRLIGLDLPDDVREALAPLAAIRHASVTTVALGFRRKEVPHKLDGFGMLTAPSERSEIMGAMFTSTLFPERAPDDHVLITCFLREAGGRGDPEDAVRRARSALQVLGIAHAPTMARATYWQAGIPQYDVGHHHALMACTRAEHEFPGLIIAGAHRGGVALGECVEHGLSAGLRATSDGRIHLLH